MVRVPRRRRFSVNSALTDSGHVLCAGFLVREGLLSRALDSLRDSLVVFVDGGCRMYGSRWIHRPGCIGAAHRPVFDGLHVVRLPDQSDLQPNG